jgi:hypothetical protein
VGEHSNKIGIPIFCSIIFIAFPPRPPFSFPPRVAPRYAREEDASAASPGTTRLCLERKKFRDCDIEIGAIHESGNP